MNPPLQLIEPDWPAPANLVALSTLRAGGSSRTPYASLNLATHVGDDPLAVAANRARLAERLPPGCQVQWLEQVHGSRVVAADPAANVIPEADACWTRTPGLACAVLTADCLPVLFCDREGSVVAAAHAGWRGLLAGVLERTVEAMGERPERLLAWLGPAIGPAAFEVGPEVRERFLAAGANADHGPISHCFAPAAGRPGHYLADLYALARVRLAALGIHRVAGGGWCTHGDPAHFFSYRRDGTTGRMATLIALAPT